MKNLLAFLLLGFIIVSCDDLIELPTADDDYEVPSTFTVDIPDELSTTEGLVGARVLDDEISGEDIYEGLRGFIKLGETSAEILEAIMKVAANGKSSNISSFTFESEDDGRKKTFTFLDDVTYDGIEYQYEMLVTDEDGSKAIQVVWNLNPVNGIAILSPYDLDRETNENAPDALFQIEYEENLDQSIQQMIVSIVDLPAKDEIDNMKMKVVKANGIVEVFGNANFPDFEIEDLLDKADRNYAFTARADEANEIAVAEVALPFSSIATADVMGDYSLYTVFDEAMVDKGVDNEDYRDEVLANTLPPAYFNEADGFLGAGTMPEGKGFSEEFSDLSDLAPYAPKDVADMKLSFLE